MSDKKREYFKLFTDMLKQRGKYSQGRVYLLISIIAYYVTLGILTWAGLHEKKAETIQMDKFEIIIEALKYAMMLFAGYVFGDKFLKVIEVLKGGGSSSDDKTD